MQTAEQERETALAEARRQARKLHEEGARQTEVEKAGLHKTARAELEAEKERIAAAGSAELERLRKECSSRLDSAADRFVALFTEAGDA